MSIATEAKNSLKCKAEELELGSRLYDVSPSQGGRVWANATANRVARVLLTDSKKWDYCVLKDSGEAPSMSGPMIPSYRQPRVDSAAKVEEFSADPTCRERIRVDYCALMDGGGTLHSWVYFEPEEQVPYLPPIVSNGKVMTNGHYSES